MDSTLSKKVTRISYTIASAFIIAMVTASVMLGDHELPETQQWQLVCGCTVNRLDQATIKDFSCPVHASRVCLSAAPVYLP